MATTSHVLFSWAEVEKLPELRPLERFLDTLPDEELIAAREAWRPEVCRTFKEVDG